MNKKKLILLILPIIFIIIIVISIFIVKEKKEEKIIKEAISKIKLKENLETEFLSEVYISDFLEDADNLNINDYKIDTTKVGKQNIEFTFKENNQEIKYTFALEIKDKTPPLVWLNKTYSTPVGTDYDFKSKVLCGDNYDSRPVCNVEGEYDYNTPGSYNLKFRATDSSGNETLKDFVLNVYEPKPNTNSPKPNTKTTTKFAEVYKEHKTENTQIGIDVSKWQGDIDFEKIKNAGVEFIMIRVGSTSGKDGEYFVDSKFEQNIKNANALGIPVGIYFYSYASSKDRAIADALWIIDKIKDYKVDLPVAFDWENWSTFNDYNLSFFELTDMAQGFLDTLKDAGYEGILYSSKTYLENIWLPINYPTWLAHYTTKTTYQKDFKYWQLCSNGRVDGIYGDVDINIRYLK